MNGFVEILHKLLPKTPISMVSRDEIIYNIWPEQARKPAAPAKLAAAVE